MARVVLCSSAIGWDAQRGAPLCSVTIYYDDVTLLLDSAEVVNGSDDTVATFSLEDTTKPLNDPNRIRSFAITPKLITKATRLIPSLPLVRIPGTGGAPARVSLPPGLAFSFSAPTSRVKGK